MFPSDKNHDKWISNLRHLETSLYPTCPDFAWSHFGTRVVSGTAFAFFCLRFLFLYLRFLFFFFVCVFFLLFAVSFFFVFEPSVPNNTYHTYLTCFMQPDPCP